MTTQLPIILDRIVLAELERERSLAGHPDVNHTLRARIAAGIDLVREGGEGLLEWRPVSSNSCTLELEVGD